MTPQETLHSILLDAKARIKDGILVNDFLLLSPGICNFVYHHLKSNIIIVQYLKDLIREHKKIHGGYLLCGAVNDFSDPDRLALLEWLIERTAP
jgi:hypothetical protein